MKTGKLAQRAGITIRTLHHYDQIGLLKPSGHSDNGYRSYAAEDVERLYRVLALRELGLPLTEIGTLLDSGQSPLEQVLERQYQHVQSEIHRHQRILGKLERLQGRLKEAAPARSEEWLELLELMQVQDKYFSPDDLAKFQSSAGEWKPLIVRARELIAQAAEPSSAAAMTLATEWVAELNRVTKGDGQLWGKLTDMLLHEPRMQAQTGIDAGVLRFLANAVTNLEADADGRPPGALEPAMSEDAYDLAYRRGAPWDLGRVQPAWSEFLEADGVEGPVLEVGCGTGDLALAVARRHPVLAIDLSQAALDEANKKAAGSGLDVQFKLWNAIELAGLQRRFGTVIDCGFFHALSSDDRRRFAQELALVTAEGARYVLLGFSIRLPMPNAPSPLTAEGLQEMLSPHWRMEWHRASRFVTRWAQNGVPALMCSLRRTGASAV